MAKHPKRTFTTGMLREYRCREDCATRAASKGKASESVIDVWSVARANRSRPPNRGKPSTQLACARAKRCMKGERLELSGLNSFVGIRFRTASPPRKSSIRISRANVHPIKPVRAIAVGLVISVTPIHQRSNAVRNRSAISCNQNRCKTVLHQELSGIPGS